MISKKTFFLLQLYGPLILTQPAFSQEIETVYLKNNGIAPAEIRINGFYQGYVPGGELCYTQRLGFLTQSSGSTRETQKESHGGWSGTGDISVAICQVTSQGNAYKTQIKLPKKAAAGLGNSELEPVVWFGETSAGTEPKDVTTARQIYKGVDGDDCGLSAIEGIAATNIKDNVVEGTWRIVFTPLDRSNGQTFQYVLKFSRDGVYMDERLLEPSDYKFEKSGDKVVFTYAYESDQFLGGCDKYKLSLEFQNGVLISSSEYHFNQIENLSGNPATKNSVGRGIKLD